MASSKKQGYVITRSKSLKEYFTAAASYNRPDWVKLDEATVYTSPELAQQAVKKLWMAGAFGAKIEPLSELQLDMEMPPEEDKQHDDGDEMIAARQSDDLEDEIKGVCPECNCDPCECDDAAMADGEPTDELSTDELSADELSSEEMPPEEGLPPEEQEEDSLLGQHLKAVAGMEGEENARLHPEELRMLGKKRPDMKEATTNEAEFKMPARPGNDPASPDENDTTAATMTDPKSTQVDFEDPVGEEDKPETDLTHATAEEHEDKCNVPAEVMSQLKAVVADFKKAAEDNNMVDDTKGSFALTAASALQQLVDDLELGTVAGIKQAQIHMSSYMNPITSHIPPDVVNFIGRGGRKSSLKDLFQVKWDKMRGVE